MDGFWQTWLHIALGLFWTAMAAGFLLLVAWPAYEMGKAAGRTPKAGCVFIEVDEDWSSLVRLRLPDGTLKCKTKQEAVKLILPDPAK